MAGKGGILKDKSLRSEQSTESTRTRGLGEDGRKSGDCYEAEGKIQWEGQD